MLTFLAMWGAHALFWFLLAYFMYLIKGKGPLITLWYAMALGLFSMLLHVCIVHLRALNLFP